MRANCALESNWMCLCVGMERAFDLMFGHMKYLIVENLSLFLTFDTYTAAQHVLDYLLPI